MTAEMVDTTTGEIVESLTSTERGDLTAAERIIERGLATFVEVGEALARIRDARLYREGHATFDAYCRERWGMAKSRAYQLIDAAETATAVSTIVDVPSVANEAQARALAPIVKAHGADAAADVLREVSKRTESITAKAITEVAAEVERERDADAEAQALYDRAGEAMRRNGMAAQIDAERPYTTALMGIRNAAHDITEKSIAAEDLAAHTPERYGHVVSDITAAADYLNRYLSALEDHRAS